jgi:hypothetical protein
MLTRAPLALDYFSGFLGEILILRVERRQGDG